MNYLFQPLSLFLASTTSNNDTNIGGISDAANSVVNISEAISKYGIVVVIMAVFFVIFMILIIIMLYSNTRMINQIISNNSDNNRQDQQLISKFVDSALDSKGIKDGDDIVNKLTQELKESLIPIQNAVAHGTTSADNRGEDYHRDLVGAYIDINMAFKDISRAAMNALMCDRVAIYVFHNGNKSMHGLPFFKMSCIHEWTSHGTNTLRGKSHTDMPLHLFNDFIENLYKAGIYIAEDVSKAAIDDPSIQEFIAFSNTKSLYLTAINDNSNALAGFIAVEFDKIDYFESDRERNKKVKSIIDDMVSKVAPIIGNKYIYKHPEEQNNR